MTDSSDGSSVKATPTEPGFAPQWQSITADPRLSRPPTPGAPGNVPAGDDLRLDIGWERFEQLLVFISRDVLGLGQVRFRRYGVPGQAQHGIDLAGRHPDGTYTVVQCKEYDTFTAALLRAAVKTFADGSRPFGATHFVVAVSTVTTTQLEDELAALQNEYSDLTIELWGAEQINDALRTRADIVSRFWTRETAETFCTGAPLPGVAAVEPNWTRVEEQILVSPLGVDGLDERLLATDRMLIEQPAAAATEYGMLAAALECEGFWGHAYVMRHKQLGALATAGNSTRAVELAAQLAASALHQGDAHQARALRHRMSELAGLDAPGRPTPSQSSNPDDAEGHTAANARHVGIVQEALSLVEHPFGEATGLLELLRELPDEDPAASYRPTIVLLLAELAFADRGCDPNTSRVLANGQPDLSDLDDLIGGALLQLSGASNGSAADRDVTLRLRLLRAGYGDAERASLLRDARQHRIPRADAAIVLAAEARRNAIDGSAEEALEYWRQAVSRAIQDKRTEDAKGWLYAIRALNIRYGPWTSQMEEEHLLAQALPKSTSGRLLGRVRDFENDARRAALDGEAVQAIRAARRWLADSIVIGDWVDEHAAAELLGDLYSANAEPARAALCYRRAGAPRKLTTLAEAVGDQLLPVVDVGVGTWWERDASLSLIQTREDLLDDDTAASLLSTLVDVMPRGRAGEFVEGPTRSLTLQVTRTMCVLAGRGTSSDAQAVLDLLVGDVPRGENEYQFHDEQHVRACLSIIDHHPDKVHAAVERIVELAEVGCHEALTTLTHEKVLGLLGSEHLGIRSSPLTTEQVDALRARLRTMAGAGRYEAGVARVELGEADDDITANAQLARDRLLNRPEPDGQTYTFGTLMVPDSYLVHILEIGEQQACLAKMLDVAEDDREAASNRADALAAARNLVLDQPAYVKESAHSRARAFVTGERDGSFLDAMTTNPHPLSTMKVNFGSPSLRGPGLALAQASAISDADELWVKEQALVMLASSDEGHLGNGAVTLSRLNHQLLSNLDAAVLASHPAAHVRKLSIIVASAAPSHYEQSLISLSRDPDHGVRTLLARQLARMLSDARDHVTSSDATEDGDTTLGDEDWNVVRSTLTAMCTDVRHSVRKTAADAVR